MQKLILIMFLSVLSVEAISAGKLVCYYECMAKRFEEFSFISMGYSNFTQEEGCKNTSYIKDNDGVLDYLLNVCLSNEKGWSLQRNPGPESRFYIDYLSLGVVDAAESGERARAFEVLSLLEERGEGAPFYILKGDVYYYFGDFEASLLYYQKALEVDDSCSLYKDRKDVSCYSLNRELALLGAFSSGLSLGNQVEACQKLEEQLDSGFDSERLRGIHSMECEQQ